MALNFPSAPNTGDIHTVGSIIWKYNGKAWDSLYEPSAPAQVGLSNVDNTSDEDKPVSTAQQAALDALTKDDVGLDNVDNTSDINKPVSTAQQAAIDAAGGGGGSSFDQDLNTTDSPTFATLTTTNTIATDVYTVDLGATGTVTASNLEINAPDGDSCQVSVVNGGDTTISNDDGLLRISGHDGLRLSRRGSEKLKISSLGVSVDGDLTPDLDQSSTSGSSSKRWSTTFTNDLDASGTVTAANIESTNNITLPAYKNLSFGSTTYAISNLLGLGGAGLSVKSWAYPVRFSGSAGVVMDVNTHSGGVDITGDVDASGTVKKGVYTVAALPTGEAGMTCFVSDANATTRGSTVAGGGANFIPVYSDGTNWIIS